MQVVTNIYLHLMHLVFAKDQLVFVWVKYWYGKKFCLEWQDLLVISSEFDVQKFRGSAFGMTKKLSSRWRNDWEISTHSYETRDFSSLRSFEM